MAFCLGTLVELLDQILHPHQYHKDWVLDNENKPQIESLFVKVSFLRDFLANSTPAVQARMETLEDLLRDAAECAEDMLESYLKAQILSNPVHHMHQIQSLFEKASFLRKFVVDSAPIQVNFEMLENLISCAVENVEDIVESYTKAQAIDHENTPQIQSLSKMSSYVRNFLANSGPAIRSIIENLEDQDSPRWLYEGLLSLEGIINGAAENAQELVMLHPNSTGQRHITAPPDLSEVIQVFDSATAEMIKITDPSGQSKKITPAIHLRRDPSHPTLSHVLVGMDKCLIELHRRLTSRYPTREIIPIVGMGGIGKTTLTRKLYSECSSCKHFDICLWATVSQEYDQRQVLLTLLDSKSDKRIEELKVDLHQKLWARRYLIVLDDVWSFKVWDDIHTCAPDNNNRSRIILTTRGNDVAHYVSTRTHEMQLLDKEDSWKLFGKIVHAGEKCPDELEEIAHEIVNKCGGLPLALQVIAGFMSRAERTKDLWEKVAADISSFIGKEDNQFSAIFSWSYANLQHYLKPCILYIGSFPEDHDIQASRLIKLWVAEGFLYPIKDKSPEEVADIYLNALIDRNLIFVREGKFGGRVKSYGIHDLLRDLCLKKAEEKKFIFAKKSVMSKDALCHRRVCVTSFVDNGDLCAMELMTQARSLQVIARADERIFPKSGFELSLLKTLDVLSIQFGQFPEEIFKLVNLKYLAISFDRAPIVFSFYGCSDFNFPVGIFHLPQLRHVQFYGSCWGPLSVVPRSFSLGETLKSLAYVPVAIVTQLLGKLPNLKSLEIEHVDETPLDIDLTSFAVLETIKVSPSYYLTPIFPQVLRELTMSFALNLSGTFMSRIGALPNLQLLQLNECEFESKKWETSEGEFCNLQYLKLTSSNLRNWIADETHFPQLEHLVIDLCRHLKEIPLEIGGIETLEIIEVDYCKRSVFDSAQSIFQEKCDFGNENLQLRLGSQLSDDDDDDDGWESL